MPVILRNMVLGVLFFILLIRVLFIVPLFVIGGLLLAGVAYVWRRIAGRDKSAGAFEEYFEDEKIIDVDYEVVMPPGRDEDKESR